MSYTTSSPTARFNSRRRANVQILLRHLATRDRKILWPDDSDRISRGTGLPASDIGLALDDLEAMGCATMTFSPDRVVIRVLSAAAAPAVPVAGSPISRRIRRARA